MKTIHLTGILISLALLFTACSSERQNPHNLSEDLLKKDNVIAGAAFQDLNGNAVNISDYKGKVVLIDFWETWCGPCLQVFPAMDSLKNNYPDDFVILAVNLQGSDDPEDVSNFKEKNGYNFEWLLDTNTIGPEVIDLGIPFKLYFDPEGYLVKAELGTAGSVEADYQKAKKVIEEYRLTK